MAVFCWLLLILVTAAASANEPTSPFRPWARPDGAALSLDDFNQKMHSLRPAQGQIAVVHFFATWCDSCREELPALRRLVARDPTLNIQLLMVSVAEPDARVRAFADKQGLDMPILMDRDRAAARHWGVTVLPTTIILDDGLGSGLWVEQDVDWDRITPIDLARLLAARPTNSRPPQGTPK